MGSTLGYALKWYLPKQYRGLPPTTLKGQRPKCGARCRDGHPCRAPAVWDKDHNRSRNGRCRMHGGLSTGPKTIEGKLRALANLKQFRAEVAVELNCAN